ncbi:MAG: YezD family protein [Opitutaceae bacterium]
MSASPTINHAVPVVSAGPEWLAVVREKVEGLRFGVVQIVVHDSKVTQIERTEKTRLDSPRPH